MDTFFVVFDMEEDWIMLNRFTLIANLNIKSIRQCKLNHVNPSLRVYKTKIRAGYEVENKDSHKAEHINKTLWEMGEAFAIIWLSRLHAYLYVLYNLVLSSLITYCSDNAVLSSCYFWVSVMNNVVIV